MDRHTGTRYQRFQVPAMCSTRTPRESTLEVRKLSYSGWKVEIKNFPTVYNTPMVFNIGMPYTAGKLFNPAFQCSEVLWVLASGVLAVDPGNIGSQVYTPKGCTLIQVLPLLNAYPNSVVVCSCIICIDIQMNLNAYTTVYACRSNCNFQAKCIYAWADNKRIGVRIDGRKYLYWCTSFWCVNLGVPQYKC